MSKGYTERIDDTEGWISRVARCLIRLSRRVTEHRDKTDYQMSLVYLILEAQNIEIKELRAGIAQLADSPERDVAGTPTPAPGSTNTMWGLLR